MTEVNDLAGQHEVIAENLQSDIIREVTILIKDFKDERKKVSLASSFYVWIGTKVCQKVDNNGSLYDNYSN